MAVDYSSGRHNVFKQKCISHDSEGTKYIILPSFSHSFLYSSTKLHKHKNKTCAKNDLIVGTGLSWWDNLAVFQVGSLLLQQASPDLLSRKWYGREGEGERCWGRDFEGELLKENIQDHFRPSLGKACYFCHNSLCLKQIKAAHIQRLGNTFYLLGEVAELTLQRS